MIRIHLLGNLKISYEDVPVTLVTGGKVLSLLAFLLLNRESPQSRKYISFLFWPDSSEQQALTNLRKLFHQLRQYIPNADCYLVADSLSIKWNHKAPYVLDIEEFELSAKGTSIQDLKKAVDIYAGLLLPGCYEGWVEPERERLSRLYQSVLEHLVAKLETRRLYPEAIKYANRLVGLDNLKEEYFQLLMRLHGLNGDLTGITKIYQDCERTLSDELGVQPSDVTKNLYRSMLQAGVNPMIHPVHSETPFVGRNREWEILTSLWQSLRNPRLVLLEGEPGIGKTRFAEEFKLWLDRQGIPTLFAKCYAAGGVLAFASITAWLRNRRIPELSPVWLTEIARIMPEILVQFPELPPPGPLKERWQTARMFEAIEHSLIDSDTMCVLFLDDIQWCDAESLELLQYLFRHDARSKFLLIATKRSGEDKDELNAMLAALQKANILTQIKLPPLSNDEMKQLACTVSERSIYAGLSDKFYADTGGNPLFIVETLRSLESSVQGEGIDLHWSPIIKHVIHNRFLQLSKQVRCLIHIASVIGRPFSLELLTLASQTDPAAVLQQTELLVEQRIFREFGDKCFDFSHDLLRETAYQSVGKVTRHRYHEQVALVLETIHKVDLDSIVGQIAHHFEQAGMVQRAIPYYKHAGKVAENVHALDLMSTYYNKLYEIVPDLEKHPILLGLGRLQEISGRWDEAIAVYKNWLVKAEVFLTLQQKAQGKTAVGNCLMLKGNYPEAMAYLKQAHLEFEWANDMQGISHVLSVMGIVNYYEGNFEESLECFEQRMNMDRAYRNVKDDSRTAGIIGNIYMEQYELEKALYWYKQKIQLAEGDKLLINHSLSGISLVYFQLDQYDHAMASIMENLSQARMLGERMGICGAIALSGVIYEKLGNYEWMKACFAYAIQESCLVGDMRLGAVFLGYLGLGLMRLRDYERAECFIELAVQYLRRIKARSSLCEILYFQALLLSERGNNLEALAKVEETLDLAVRLKRTRFRYCSTLLKIVLQANAGKIGKQEALVQLQALKEKQTYMRDQADIDYNCWRLGLITKEQGINVAQSYLQLYSTVRNGEYRTRYMEMSGEDLPEIHEYPELPCEVEQTSLDMEELAMKIKSWFA